MDIELRDFNQWFVENTWDIEQSMSAATIDLADQISELLIEYSDRNISAPELRESLRRIMRSGPLVANLAKEPRRNYSYGSSAPRISVYAKA